jgi:ABC-2 type transport system ATP-binding protein
VLEVVEKLCHKIAIIKKGKLITVGTTPDILGDKTLENVFLDLQNS